VSFSTPNSSQYLFFSIFLLITLIPFCDHLFSTLLMSTVQPSTPATFYIPELSRPAPVVSVEFRRSPASSFSKSARPIGNPFDLRRLSVDSASSSTLPPPYPHDHDRDSRIPEYGEDQEVQTMARSLFYYGFSEWQIPA
jgi:hypothetical protein